MLTTLKTMIRDEKGATMVEYGLLVALIALVAIVGVKTLGTKLNSLFSSAASSLAPGPVRRG
jgi:pilus assembly protein Flp/PilA